MTGPAASVAQVRVAVRAVLSDLPAGALVLVAASGGADSTALAAAMAFEAPRAGLRAGLVTVDHGLQAGSAAQAQRVAALGESLGLDPVEVLAATVVEDGGGPEAAARQARYAALDSASRRLGAAAVLLGHTLDDQAETVLLGLARGSGARSLAGMAASRGLLRRPLLAVTRAATVAACAAEALPVWSDPHNDDPRYARVRVRREALPALEATLGPGVAAALARTAASLRDDADVLDALAADLHLRCAGPDGLDLTVLAAAPPALRRRVLRLACLAAGSPSGALGAVHLQALDALVRDWRGQGPVHLPGGIEGVRRSGRLALTIGGPGATRLPAREASP